MSLRSLLATGAWLASALPAWRRYRRALAQPASAQESLLHRLLQANASSAYGKALGFSKIRNSRDYRERVPLVTYEDLLPWITRIGRGESGILTMEPVMSFVPTTGSTGGRKLIPFTRRFQQELNSAIGPWLVDLCRWHPSVAAGPAYWSISPALPARADEDSAIPVGFEDDSGYLGGLRRKLVELTFAAPSALRHAPDVETLRYLTLLCLLRRQDLAFISVWHPSFLTLLFDAMPGWWDELLGDVRTGDCRRADRMGAGLRRAIASRPQPWRAEALARLSPGDFSGIWPGLRTVSCWGDGQAALACRALQRRLQGFSVQPKGLLATEAFVSIPFRGRYPVAVCSHFFEFLDAAGRSRLCHEISVGETYSVVVSTGGGLWRYRLGDLVEVTGFIEATPSLRFLGREGNVSDLAGEKMSEVFVTEVLAGLFLADGREPPFALLAPERDGYVLFLEAEIPSGLADRLDAALSKNPHYAICRNLRQLSPPRCFRIHTGGYETYTAHQMGKGQALGDIKPRALSSEPGWAERFRGRFSDG